MTGARHWRPTAQEHLLIRLRNAHVQTLLGDGLKFRSARVITNRRLELDPLGGERIATTLKIEQFPLVLNSRHPTCNDACRRENEPDEDEGDHRPPAGGYLALCHARRRALRARGLSRTSSADAMTARRVIVTPNGRPRHVQIGCFGGQIQAALHSRNAFFTRRSSPE